MDKSLTEQINYYYNKNEDQKFLQFKSENKDTIFTSQYMLYSQKCIDIINSLENKNIESSLNNLKNIIIDMSNKLNEATHIVKDIQTSEKNNTNQNQIIEKNYNEFSSYYKNESEKILNTINDNLNKIKKSTYTSEYEMLSNAKKINNSKKNELKLQQLKNTLTENLKTLDYSLKEKNSKILSIENKKNSLNDNKLKIEKLKDEYNLNSERMAKEIANNEKCQNEIDMLLQEIDELHKKGYNEENKEQNIKNEQDKLNKLIKDNTLIMNDLINKKNNIEQDLKKRRNEIFGMFFLNYYLINKINGINNVNNYNYFLSKKIMNMKELSNKLGLKASKIQEETSYIEKRFLKYQLFLQTTGNEII